MRKPTEHVVVSNIGHLQSILQAFSMMMDVVENPRCVFHILGYFGDVHLSASRSFLFLNSPFNSLKQQGARHS